MKKPICTHLQASAHAEHRSIANYYVGQQTKVALSTGKADANKKSKVHDREKERERERNFALATPTMLPTQNWSSFGRSIAPGCPFSNGKSRDRSLASSERRICISITSEQPASRPNPGWRRRRWQPSIGLGKLVAVRTSQQVNLMARH